MLTKTQPEPDLFSYAALSREDEAAAREDAALIKAHMKSAAESIIAVGLALKRQKERLPHGMFLPWITAEFDMKIRTAQVIMQRAERWSKYASSAHLPAGQSAALLDEITDPSLPTEVRDRVESLLVDGQKVTVADIRKMKVQQFGARFIRLALASHGLSKDPRQIPAPLAFARAWSAAYRPPLYFGQSSAHPLRTSQRLTSVPSDRKQDPIHLLPPWPGSRSIRRHVVGLEAARKLSSAKAASFPHR